MQILLLDKWEKFKSKRGLVYHISTIDKLESIKKFGLNTVLTTLNRRGYANTEGIYLTTDIKEAIRGMKHLEGIDEKNLILFAVPVKEVVNDLYLDLEMTCIGSFMNTNTPYITTGNHVVELEKKFPCKYRRDGDYSHYIDFLLSKGILLEYDYEDEDFEEDEDAYYVDENTIKDILSDLHRASCFYCTKTIPYNKLTFLGRLVDVLSKKQRLSDDDDDLIMRNKRSNKSAGLYVRKDYVK